MKNNNNRSQRGGRRAPPTTPAPVTLSASSIVDALKSMEKNPFFMNNAIPVMKGEAMVDNSALRMTGSLERSVNLGEMSLWSGTLKQHSGGGTQAGVGNRLTRCDDLFKVSGALTPSSDRKVVPIDRYSRGTEFQKALLRVPSLTSAGAGAGAGADDVKDTRNDGD